MAEPRVGRSGAAASPVAVVVDDTMMPDFGTMFVNGKAHPKDGEPLPYDDDVLRDPRDVYVGPYFIRLGVLAWQPLMRLEWWDTEPHHDGCNWPEPWELLAAGSMDVPDGYVTASFITLGLEGQAPLTIPVPHPQFRVLVAHHHDRDREGWLVQFWPLTPA